MSSDVTHTAAADNPDLLDELQDFLHDYYYEDIGQLLQRYPKEQRSLEISWRDLHRANPAYAEDLREQPQQMRAYLEEALRLMDVPVDIKNFDPHVRVTDLPESERFSVGEYRSSHVSQFIGIEGQVSKASDVRPRPETLAFECQRCGTETMVPQHSDSVSEPHECNGCERQGPFRVNKQASEWTDHQLVRIQQPPEETAGGQGSHIDVHFEDDLVGSAQPGDRVNVSGVLDLQAPSQNSNTRDYTPILQGNGTEVKETDYEEIDIASHREEVEKLAAGEYGDPFELLMESLAPKVEGYEHIKEGLVLQMFGGVRAQHPNGSYDRGDFHVLLIGDPGTSKSTFLRAVEELAPRSTYASGKGASAAGMTAAAVADDFGDSKWTLEAGALVLANKGVACVDEIDKVNEDAVSSMHDALESQTVHVNKAGINAHLPAQTSLLAAGNPKYGRFDPYESIGSQFDLGPTLLSRFDLIFTLQDKPEEERDRTISKAIASRRQLASKFTHDGSELTDDERAEIEAPVPAKLFRAYIAHAKQTCFPRIEDESVMQYATDAFVTLRSVNGDDDDSPVPVTFRSLEAVLRLAEASARIRLSDTVEREDVERANRLIGRSIRDVGMDPDTGEFDADIVEAGASRSQAERKKAVEKLIKDEQQGSKMGAKVSRVVDRAVDMDFRRDKVRHEIDTFRNEGRAYFNDEAEEFVRWV